MKKEKSKEENLVICSIKNAYCEKLGYMYAEPYDICQRSKPEAKLIPVEPKNTPKEPNFALEILIKDIVKAQLQPLENKVEGLEQQIQQLKQLLHFICKTVLPPNEPLKDVNVFNK